MELHSNASNNAVFSDAKGNIVYLHSNYIPRRDTSFDWTAPVHGSDPAERYASGNLRPVYFDRAQLRGHTELEYHPGR